MVVQKLPSALHKSEENDKINREEKRSEEESAEGGGGGKGRFDRDAGWRRNEEEHTSFVLCSMRR